MQRDTVHVPALRKACVNDNEERSPTHSALSIPLDEASDPIQRTFGLIISARIAGAPSYIYEVGSLSSTLKEGVRRVVPVIDAPSWRRQTVSVP